MAHKEQIEYCNQVKKLYPEYFDGVYVLDAGSLDINGNNQYLFTNSHYIGLDIGEGKNVDIVSKIHELQLPDNTFDTIISTEVFEHDQYYTDSIKNIYRMLKPGGMFLFTCATIGRAEHGTRRTRPQDAPLLQSDEEWQDYYKNLTEDDIKEIFDLDRHFYKHQFKVNSSSHDLYFWGIKNGIWQKRNDRSYHITNNISNIELEKLKKEFAEKEEISKKRHHIILNHQEIIENKNQELKQKNNECLNLNKEVESKNQNIQNLNKEVESKNQNIQNLNKEVESKNQNIQNLNKHIEVLKEELTLVYTSKSWQITRPIRKLKKILKGNKK